ncbi:MAG: hypothetical protein GY847_41660 [Proteobacteria bacterium]|nr:hypothetical protein [Pseudomonadota bacterium]
MILSRNTTKLATGLVIISLFFTMFASTGTIAKTGTFYDVKVETAVKQGKTIATITATGKSGYHCNKLYPWKLAITPGPEIEIKKTVYKKKDAKKFAEDAVIFKISYLKKADSKMRAKLKLSMCDEKQCKMETVTLSW